MHMMELIGVSGKVPGMNILGLARVVAQRSTCLHRQLEWCWSGRTNPFPGYNGAPQRFAALFGGRLLAG